MLNRLVVLGVTGLGVVTAGPGCRAAAPVDSSRASVRNLDDGEKNEKEEKDEQKVPIDQLPSAVVDTVKKEVPDGTITEAEKEKKHDKTVYEIDVKTTDTKYEIKTKEDGKFISKKVDDDDDDAGAKK